MAVLTRLECDASVTLATERDSSVTFEVYRRRVQFFPAVSFATMDRKSSVWND